jgi:hypothetical protein
MTAIYILPQPPVGSYSAQAQQTDRGTQEKQARLQEVLKGILDKDPLCKAMECLGCIVRLML